MISLPRAIALLGLSSCFGSAMALSDFSFSVSADISEGLNDVLVSLKVHISDSETASFGAADPSAPTSTPFRTHGLGIVDTQSWSDNLLWPDSNPPPFRLHSAVAESLTFDEPAHGQVAAHTWTAVPFRRVYDGDGSVAAQGGISRSFNPASFGGEFTLLLITREWQWQLHEGTYTKTWLKTYYDRRTYSMSKLLCDAVSIDSRKCYGQPNSEGVIDLDPNNGLQNVKFSGSIFKGGLFVGCSIPGSTKDESGLARIQLYGPETTTITSPLAATLSILSLPKLTRTGFRPANAPNIKLSRINAGDTQIDVEPADVIWATKWTIDSTTVGLSKEIDTSSNYWSANWAFVNLPVPIASGEPLKFVLALSDEAITTPTWLYFAGPSYIASLPSPQAPLTGRQPWIWLVDQTASNGAYDWEVTPQ